MVGGKANRGTAIGATGIAAVFATALAVAVGISAVAQSLRPESSAHRVLRFADTGAFDPCGLTMHPASSPAWIVRAMSVKVRFGRFLTPDRHAVPSDANHTDRARVVRRQHLRAAFHGWRLRGLRILHGRSLQRLFGENWLQEEALVRSRHGQRELRGSYWRRVPVERELPHLNEVLRMRIHRRPRPDRDRRACRRAV
jgi:hypothetical protein